MSLLASRQGRLPCPFCKTSCKFYCSKCVALVGEPSLIPSIQLPFSLHIIRHPAEKSSKSSAIPLKLLAPSSVELYNFPVMPSVAAEDAILLFPSNDAMFADSVDWSEVRHVLCIDCTWFQTSSILRMPALQRLRKVKLTERITSFWRHQAVNKHCLATVEAVYYLLRDCFPQKSVPTAETREANNFTSMTRETTALTKDNEGQWGGMEECKDLASALPPSEKPGGSSPSFEDNYDGRWESVLFFFDLNKKMMENKGRERCHFDASAQRRLRLREKNKQRNLKRWLPDAAIEKIEKEEQSSTPHSSAASN